MVGMARFGAPPSLVDLAQLGSSMSLRRPGQLVPGLISWCVGADFMGISWGFHGYGREPINNPPKNGGFMVIIMGMDDKPRKSVDLYGFMVIILGW